jgi:hypothetical protein
VPSVNPDGIAWLSQTSKNKKAFNKKFGMDTNLGVMTVRRQSRRKASPITRWSQSADSEFGWKGDPFQLKRLCANNF